MNLKDPVKLVSQLLDLPVIDKNERWCGIVDDVELEGSAGKVMRVKALLIGPGAYEGRLPAWMFWITRKIAGEHMVRVPADEIIEIGSVVKLRSEAGKFRLQLAENRVRCWIPRVGAM